MISGLTSISEVAQKSLTHRGGPVVRCVFQAVPVSTHFEDDIFVVSMIDEYAYDDLTQAIISGYGDPNFTRTTPVLVDARQSKANPSSEDVRQTSKRVIGRLPAGHKGKWAVLVGQGPLRFGIGRMGALTMGSLGIPMEVFTEIGPALEFLRH